MPRTLPWATKKKSPELSRTKKPATPKQPPPERTNIASDIDDAEEDDKLLKPTSSGSATARRGNFLIVP